eukprot:scaffold965_cov262-Pinguiococcus_pyrenoidosus.AAC.13
MKDALLAGSADLSGAESQRREAFGAPKGNSLTASLASQIFFDQSRSGSHFIGSSVSADEPSFSCRVRKQDIEATHERRWRGSHAPHSSCGDAFSGEAAPERHCVHHPESPVLHSAHETRREPQRERIDLTRGFPRRRLGKIPPISVVLSPSSFSKPRDILTRELNHAGAGWSHSRRPEGRSQAALAEDRGSRGLGGASAALLEHAARELRLASGVQALSIATLGKPTGNVEERRRPAWSKQRGTSQVEPANPAAAASAHFFLRCTTLREVLLQLARGVARMSQKEADRSYRSFSSKLPATIIDDDVDLLVRFCRAWVDGSAMDRVGVHIDAMLKTSEDEWLPEPKALLAFETVYYGMTAGLISGFQALPGVPRRQSRLYRNSTRNYLRDDVEFPMKFRCCFAWAAADDPHPAVKAKPSLDSLARKEALVRVAEAQFAEEFSNASKEMQEEFKQKDEKYWASRVENRQYYGLSFLFLSTIFALDLYSMDI